jgi:hypothetical protein
MKRRVILTAMICVFTLSHDASSQDNAGSKDPATHRQETRIWVPQPVPVFSPKLKATIPKELVSSLRVSESVITLEKTRLRNVQKQLGGTIGGQGDASEYLQWLCLSGTDKDQRWVLWLESGEIDGGMVGEFQLRRIAVDAKLDSRCQVLKEGSGVVLPFSLRLGMAEEDVLNALGRPTARRRDSLFYRHYHEGVIRNQPYESGNEVTVVVQDGVVWALQVWKSTQF